MLLLLNDLKQCPLVKDAYPFGEYHHVVMKEGGEEELKKYLDRLGRRYELKKARPDIEDCFMALMKN
jgi:ABC-2 type transport system ATP-binding protein